MISLNQKKYNSKNNIYSFDVIYKADNEKNMNSIEETWRDSKKELCSHISQHLNWLLIF
jgi:hypothetical protein